MKILNRITVSFSSKETLHHIMKSANFRKYDIFAVMPLTHEAFLHTCNNVEAEIFCLNVEDKLRVNKNRKLFGLMIARGFYIEFPYGPAIEDSFTRRYIINSSHLIHSMTKSKNIILSSGANSAMYIRSPYDIINLALIFGLSEQQAKSSISHNGRQLFLNSVGRRHGKSIMFVEKSSNSSTGNNTVISLSDSEEPIVILEDSFNGGNNAKKQKTF